MSFSQIPLSEIQQPLTTEPLSFEEWLDFAKRGQSKGKKDCTPGKSYPCKSICLTTAKNCRNPLDGQAKTYADWLKAGGEKIKATKPETSLAKKRREAKEARANASKLAQKAKTKTERVYKNSLGEKVGIAVNKKGLIFRDDQGGETTIDKDLAQKVLQDIKNVKAGVIGANGVSADKIYDPDTEDYVQVKVRPGSDLSTPYIDIRQGEGRSKSTGKHGVRGRFGLRTGELIFTKGLKAIDELN